MWASVVSSAIREGDDGFGDALNQFSKQTIRRKPNANVADGSTMSACYLQQSLPGLLDMTAKYTAKHDVWGGLLANANVGG